MGLKILHSADWHLDSPFAAFSGEAREYLRAAQRTIPQRVAELCRREECDMVLLAGDLFDGTPAPDTVRMVKEAMESCTVPVLIAPGNHDFHSPESPWVTSWPENVFVFFQPFAVAPVGLDCRVYGIGYRSMDCPPLLEGFRAKGPEKYKLMVLHGDPLAGNSPCCPVTAAQVKESGLSYLALGHIHKAGSFQAGQTLCGWPGCPMGRGWDETGEKGVYIVELGTRTKLRTVSLGLPQFRQLQVECEGDGITALQRLLPAAPSGDFYRVTLTGFRGEQEGAVRQAFSHLPHLTLRDEREDGERLWAEAGEDSLRGTYFQLLQQQAETDPRATVAARISRQILQGREVKLP